MKSDKKKDALLSMIRQGKPMTLGEQARLVMFLATPAILAQLTTTMMQYIDASMVGSMGAQASASIGLMETTMWLLGSICSAAAAGFYVQVSHQLGANDAAQARSTLRQGIMSVFCMGGDARGVTISGAQYPLDDASLSAEFPLGVSNHFIGKPITVSVRSGSLLIGLLDK